MAYLVAGPFIALVGIVAVFFVFRRKSVERRSMYSARRQQIEHKVRAARQRTLAPRGHEEKPAATTVAAPGAQQPGQAFEYFTPSNSAGAPPQAPAYQPAAFEATQAMPPPPPTTPPPSTQQWEAPAAPQQMPWDVPATPAPQAAPEQMPWDVPAAAASAPPASPPSAPSTFDYPSAPPAPPEQFRPAPEPSPRNQPSEPAWTPAPAPSAPGTQIDQPAAAATTSAGGWSIVTTTKESAAVAAEPERKKKKGKVEDAGAAWQLASGEAPGLDAEEPEVKRPSGTVIALAQYAILVVGLVMVLIGVLVMVASSHVT